LQISLTRIFKTLIPEFQFRLKQNTTELQGYFPDYLRVVGKGEKTQNVMANSFGFGGHNVSLVLGKLR